MYFFLKINLLLILQLCIVNSNNFKSDPFENCNTIDVNNQKVTMNKVAFLELTAVQLKNVKKSPDWKNLIQEGTKIKSKGGYHILSGKMNNGAKICAVLQNGKNDKNSIEYTPYFSIIVASDFEMMYCSCGNNLVEQWGDNCQHYQTVDGGLGCAGSCVGMNGQKCTITSFNLTTGAITVVN